MRFYDALQLDPSILKNKIRESHITKDKWKLLVAMASRSILIVFFAILLISPVSKPFGAENNAMAVAMFCIFLGLRFVDFGCCIKDSLINLAAVFLLLLFAPVLATYSNPVLAILIHFAAFFTILFMTSDKPELGNAGIYTFAYIYLSGNPVTGELLWKRSILALIGYVLCAVLLYAKHHNKNKSVRFLSKVSEMHISDKKIQWQIQLALGVAILLALGNFLNMERMMWAAFAGGSILGCYSATASDLKKRLGQRMIGTFAGALVFFIVYQFVPESLRPILGPLGGICLGFCTDYKFKTASNCIGALFMATSLYGLGKSVILRVANTFIGIAFGYIFFLLFQKVMDAIFNSKAPHGAKSAG